MTISESVHQDRRGHGQACESTFCLAVCISALRAVGVPEEDIEKARKQA